MVFARTPDAHVMFPASWHASNMVLAAKLLGRHQGSVRKILWDPEVDCVTRPDRWFKRYYTGRDNKRRFAVHEAFFPGQVVGLNCAVPSEVSDDDLVQLMNIAGRYKGLSPWDPGEYGQFQVESIALRRGPAIPPAATQKESEQQSNVSA